MAFGANWRCGSKSTALSFSCPCFLPRPACGRKSVCSKQGRLADLSGDYYDRDAREAWGQRAHRALGGHVMARVAAAGGVDEYPRIDGTHRAQSRLRTAHPVAAPFQQARAYGPRDHDPDRAAPVAFGRSRPSNCLQHWNRPAVDSTTLPATMTAIS